jgi:hypothetical protein
LEGGEGEEEAGATGGAGHGSGAQGKSALLCPFPGCNKTLAWQWSLETHMRTHLGDEGRVFKCEHCSKGFLTLGCLRSHVRIHTRAENSLACNEPGCNKSYSTAEGLRLHIRNHHSVDKKWVCAVEGCGRSFVRQTDLRLHLIRIHSHSRPFPCTVPACRKSFACYSELKRHLLCHNRAKRRKKSTDEFDSDDDVARAATAAAAAAATAAAAAAGAEAGSGHAGDAGDASSLPSRRATSFSIDSTSSLSSLLNSTTFAIGPPGEQGVGVGAGVSVDSNSSINTGNNNGGGSEFLAPKLNGGLHGARAFLQALAAQPLTGAGLPEPLRSPSPGAAAELQAAEALITWAQQGEAPYVFARSELPGFLSPHSAPGGFSRSYAKVASRAKPELPELLRAGGATVGTSPSPPPPLPPPPLPLPQEPEGLQQRHLQLLRRSLPQIKVEGPPARVPNPKYS